MTKAQAVEQITNAVWEYDKGVITAAALETIIDETCNQLAHDSFVAGEAYADDPVPAEDDDEEYEVEFYDDDDNVIDEDEL